MREQLEQLIAQYREQLPELEEYQPVYGDGGMSIERHTKSLVLRDVIADLEKILEES